MVTNISEVQINGFDLQLKLYGTRRKAKYSFQILLSQVLSERRLDPSILVQHLVLLPQQGKDTRRR